MVVALELVLMVPINSRASTELVVLLIMSSLVGISGMESESLMVSDSSKMIDSSSLGGIMSSEVVGVLTSCVATSGVGVADTLEAW